MPFTQRDVDHELGSCINNLLSQVGVVAHVSYERRFRDPFITVYGYFPDGNNTSLEQINEYIPSSITFQERTYPVVSSFCAVGESD